MPKKEPIREIIISTSKKTKNEVKEIKAELTKLLVKSVLKNENRLKNNKQ